ncbi:MAG: acetyl-CoA carboxylase biotin carboxyl carrier protein [Limnochordaceae bacterium]|nr:acetyl-CoA carboxylase biotin carboxyl carrier protein [Limnochordaceae bacterium]
MAGVTGTSTAGSAGVELGLSQPGGSETGSPLPAGTAASPRAVSAEAAVANAGHGAAAPSSGGGPKAAEAVGVSVPPATVSAVSSSLAGAPVSGGTPGAGTAPARGDGGAQALLADEPQQVPVVAPMVGTFYRGPSPDAPPFVEVGSRVTAGQTLCIIEAMKLMNEITAEVAGRVVAILAEDGEPVEYGQTLLLIEPETRG